MTQQPERDALEAAARAIYEQSFQNAIATLGNPDTFGGWTLDSGNLRAFITAYLAALSAQGMRVMPREATDEMICAGIAERHGQPVPEAWSLATANIWRSMWDSFADLKEPARAESDRVEPSNPSNLAAGGEP